MAYQECATSQNNDELFVAPTNGSAPAVALVNLFGPNDTFAWYDNAHLLVNRYATSAPYGALDGVYEVPIVP